MQATLEDVELSAGSGGTRVFGPDHDRALAELRAAQIALAQAWARSEADDAIETSSSIVTGGAPATRRPPHNAGTGSDNEVQNLKGALGDIGVAAASPASAAAAATTTTAGGGSAGAPSTGGSTTAAAAATTAPGGAGGDHHTDAGRSAAGGGTTTRPGSSSAAGTATGGIGGGERLGTKLVQETQTDILHARKRREANDRYFGRVDQGVRDVVARLGEVAAAMQAVEQETRDVWGSGSNSSDEGSVAGSVKG